MRQHALEKWSITTPEEERKLVGKSRKQYVTVVFFEWTVDVNFLLVDWNHDTLWTDNRNRCFNVFEVSFEVFEAKSN